eukprot:TRINITY_DN24743_c0_g1_i1.p1 TRINITY_DN24743_c0_g1~~TRINITY_DN24743_c0_g1_i1.p1  ORF type:complete len:160 (-),score=21.19 TRINITY_DN24743_c0_g1_i1:153-632(-)
MFHWDEMIYTEVQTVMTILSTACNLLLLPFLSYTLDIPDHIIGVMATMSSFSDLVVTALAQTGRSYIFAACLGLMGSQSSMVIRSLLSKLVPKSDLGKIYSMLGSLENIIPLMFSPTPHLHLQQHTGHLPRRGLRSLCLHYWRCSHLLRLCQLSGGEKS